MGDIHYKRRHKELGLCTSCSRPALPYSTRCEVHHPTHAAATKKDKTRRYEEDQRCYACGRPLLELDLVMGWKTCCACNDGYLKGFAWS